MTRRTPTRVVIGILALAFAVFGWGVQYKRSLYEPPDSVSIQIPHAKLLSPKERSVSYVEPNAVHPAPPKFQSPVSHLAFLIAAIVLGSRIVVSCSLWDLAADIVSIQQRRANSDYFSFRPPPVLLPAN